MNAETTQSAARAKAWPWVTRLACSLWGIWALAACTAMPTATIPAQRGTDDTTTAQRESADLGSEDASEQLFFDTAALDTSRPVARIGLGSCLHQDRPQPILEPIVDEKFDVFLFLGDNVYGDVIPPSLGELEAAYGRQAASPAWRRLAAQTPLLATWDDHDYGLNDAGADFVGRQEAQRLFERFWKIDPKSERAQTPGVYDAVVLGPEGQRVQILLLDTRYFRSPWVPSPRPGEPGRERYIPDPDPEKTVLGDVQWAWLAQQLQQPADLRLLVSSIQVLADGHGWEAWRLLPEERQRLYRTLRQSRASGIILLSGDRHRAGIYRRDSALPYPLYEMTASALNMPIEDGLEEAGPQRLGPTYRQPNYGAVEIDWARGHVVLEIRDLDGQRVLRQELELAELQVPGD